MVNISVNLVYRNNKELKTKAMDDDKFEADSIRSHYWQELSKHFIAAAEHMQIKEVKKRTIDCANGVGGDIIKHFQKELKQYF